MCAPSFIIIARLHTFTSVRWDRIFTVNGTSDLATRTRATKKSHSSLRFFFHGVFFWSIDFAGQSIQYSRAAVQRDTYVHSSSSTQFGYNKCHEYKLRKVSFSHYDIVRAFFYVRFFIFGPLFFLFWFINVTHVIKFAFYHGNFHWIMPSCDKHPLST